MMTYTMLILAVCRMHVTKELSQITLLSMSSGSSVDIGVREVMGLIHVRETNFFFPHRSVMLTSSLFTFHYRT